MSGLTDIKGRRQSEISGGTNQETKICKNLEISGGYKPSDENLQKFRLFQEGMVWEASPSKFQNFGINLVHSGEYSGGIFVEMET